MRFVLIVALLLLGRAPLVAAGKARHVVVIVWDGMRPDFVSQQNTPTLYGLTQQGVTCLHHHAVYLSGTEVNGTALSTGAYPAHSGIIANSEYRPRINPEKSIHTEGVADVRKGDELTGGHYLAFPTVAEIVRESGGKAVVAGAKPVALLPDRLARTSLDQGANVFAGLTLPTSLLQTLTGRYGEFPKEGAMNPSRNDWTTDALLDPLWKESVPEFTFLWLNEPDWSQHHTSPGSKQSLAAMRNSDQNLGRILKTLETKGVRNETDIIVVSDHGCSTSARKVDVAEGLRKAGFKATREFNAAPETDEILVVSNSGSTLLYLIGHDQKVIERVVRFLQSSDFAGVIFTQQKMPGTFSLKQVHLDSPDAPDVVVSMRWNSEQNTNGVAGMIHSDISMFGPGQGLHVSLSRFDMHATLIAAGPDFRSAVENMLPTGNTDIAPTVLWILGIKPPKPMDGRVLTEMLTVPGPKLQSFEPGRLEATQQLEGSVYRQYIKFAEVNGVQYLHEGNSEITKQQ